MLRTSAEIATKVDLDLLSDRITRAIDLLELAKSACNDRASYQVIGILASVDTYMDDIRAIRRYAEMARDY